MLLVSGVHRVSYRQAYTETPLPTLTRWLIRTALVCCAAAFLLGVALAVAPLRSAHPMLAAAWPSYIHLLVVGWITQLIMGVAYWMFPRAERRPAAGPDRLGWMAYGAINLGLVCRLIAEPAGAAPGGHPPGWLFPVSAALQLAGILAFVTGIWPRVRTR